MPASIHSLGAILQEWRIAQRCAIPQWAQLLQQGGLRGTEVDISLLLVTLEATDGWTYAYTCDAFDEFLDALNATIRRPATDDSRWAKLYLAFMPHRVAQLIPTAP
ncbi:MAG TPA: hypothetical protein VJN88_10580 [Ktedonobacterales bacterium]|nr:hypothetical protein [Ktedonobacterales bacterium]